MKKILTATIIQKNEIHIKDTCDGNIFLMPTYGGHFEGEIGEGKVESIGMITSVCPKQGRNDMSGTVLLSTGEGDFIVMNMNAYLDMPVEYEEKLSDQEAVSLDDKGVYSKGTVNFKTNSNAFKCLERKVFVCTLNLEGWDNCVITVYDTESI